MRFSLAWLRDFVDVNLTPDALAARLTTAGFQVESWEELPTPAQGVSPDVALEIDITANRPDAMNHLGLAREIAALLDRPLKLPSCTLAEVPLPASSAATIAVEAPDLCPRYVGRVVLDTCTAPSPDWLRARLSAIGLASKNTIVDAANYVLFELGQPLHTFDLDRLEGRGVVVRRSRAGETITTVVDRIERRLPEGALVIADSGGAGRPAAIAGVMGGLRTAIAETTRHVLIESAWFDPRSVRRTARALGLHTDASHRFERGVDPGMTLFAARRLASLIAELGGGRVLSGDIDVRAGNPDVELRSPAAGSGTRDAVSSTGSGAAKTSSLSAEGAPTSRTVRLEVQHRPEPILLRTQNVHGLLGTQPPDDIPALLARLGIEAAAPANASGSTSRTDATGRSYRIPTWRADITREVDLIEEYARLVGYDTIKETLPRIPPVAPRASLSEREDAVRARLAAAGYREIITYAMISDADDRLFSPIPIGGEPGALLRIGNPLSERWEVMRRSLLPGLARTLAFNTAHGRDDLKLFEVGSVHDRTASGERRELSALAVGGSGLASGPRWPDTPRAFDIHDLRGAIGAAIDGLCGDEARSRLVFDPPGDAAPRGQDSSEHGWPFHPGQSFSIVHDGVTIGRGGRLDAQVERTIEADRPLMVAEIVLAPFLASPRPVRYRGVPRLNPVERDLSFLVDRSVRFASVDREVQAAVNTIGIEGVDPPTVILIDRFEGGSLPPKMVSYAFRFRFAPRERALTAEELNGAIERIAGHLVTSIEAQIRSR